MPDTSHPNDREIAEAIRRVAVDDAMRFDVARGRRLLSAKLASSPETPSRGVPRPLADDATVARAALSWRRMALLGAALASAAFGVFAFGRRPSAPAPLHYVTGQGERRDLTLPDGSRITLAPESWLEVASDFGGTTRMVTLRGQAYVTVAHASGAPFIVRTGTIETRVLGTTFDVKYYPGDTAVRVAVLTGRVAERNWRGTVHLAAGDVSLITDSSVTVTRGTDVQSSVAWTQGRLLFTDTPVPAMLASLSRWYGYRFELTDSALVGRYVTASFDVTKPDEALVVLRGMLDVTTTITGRRVVLTPRQRTQRAPAPERRGKTDLLPTETEMGR